MADVFKEFRGSSPEATSSTSRWPSSSAALTAIVTSVVEGLITPLIGVLGGKDFRQMTFTVNDSVFSYGIVINAVIYFITVSAVVFFLVVKPLNMLAERRRRGEEPPAEELSDEAVAHRDPRPAAGAVGRRRLDRALLRRPQAVGRAPVLDGVVTRAVPAPASVLQLLAEVELLAQPPDGVELGLEPVDVLFLGREHVGQQLAGAVVAQLDGQGDALLKRSTACARSRGRGGAARSGPHPAARTRAAAGWDASR